MHYQEYSTSGDSRHVTTVWAKLFNEILNFYNYKL